MCFFETPSYEPVEVKPVGGYVRNGVEYRFWRCPEGETVVVSKDLGIVKLFGEEPSSFDAYCESSLCRRMCECVPADDLDTAPSVTRVSRCWKA